MFAFPFSRIFLLFSRAALSALYPFPATKLPPSHLDAQQNRFPKSGYPRLGPQVVSPAPWWLPTLSHSGTSCAASVAASKWQWHRSGKEQLASCGMTGSLQASHKKQNLSYSSGTQEKQQAVPLNLPNYSAVTRQVFFATWTTTWFPSCFHAFLLQLLNCCMLRDPYLLLFRQAEWRTLPRWFSQ